MENGSILKPEAMDQEELIRRQMSKVKLRSGIFIESYVYTKIPISGGYTLTYRITYAGACTTWKEIVATKLHKTHEIKFEYALGCESQIVDVHLVAIPHQEGVKTLETVMHFDLHSLLTDPSKPHRPMKTTLQEQKASDKVDVRMKAWEVKLDSLFKVRFDVNLCLNEKPLGLDTRRIRLKLNELNFGSLSHVVDQDEYGRYQKEKHMFTFPRFEFTNDLMVSTTPIPLKTMVLEIYEDV
mmetsp:Transcript_16258/g.22275  ORF Transcript_16258/g.22275 Transcript_16258/m.22275 type:complete len:240 (+) Transcript_16258:119-838(+)